MPTAVISPPFTPAPAPLRPRHQFTWQQLDQMVAARQLPESGCELIEGDLIGKLPKNARHILATFNVRAACARVFGQECVLSLAPLVLGETNQPEPDVYVLRQPAPVILAARKPAAEDVILVVEVSDTTLAYDMTEKARLYAQAGIADYWVIDVEGRRAVVHRSPKDGTYADVAAYELGETVVPLGAPQAAITVADMIAGH